MFVVHWATLEEAYVSSSYDKKTSETKPGFFARVAGE